jgi:hypothetical protein
LVKVASGEHFRFLVRFQPAEDDSGGSNVRVGVDGSVDLPGMRPEVINQEDGAGHAHIIHVCMAALHFTARPTDEVDD